MFSLIMLPLLSSVVGGLISLATTLVVLGKKNKFDQQRLILDRLIQRKSYAIDELKNHYVDFCNYFLSIFNLYHTFALVVNSQMTYDEWFVLKLENGSFDPAKMALAAFLFDNNEKIEEFYKIRDRLSDLYLITDLRKYKKGMEIDLDTSQYDSLMKLLVDAGDNYKRFVLEQIKRKTDELNMIGDKEK